ncbi:MAG TPA: hypothetical protein PKE21_08800 [Flavobacteriales bacterium]|nr:hypothetical protein [Flavobacteriales bacterium]HMR27560.1 hypothetical protein [Flavobacteriales bacterium]
MPDPGTPHIHCTAKLAKLLGVKAPNTVADADGWNANLFPIAGRKCIILVHKATFFSLIKYDVVKADLKDFPGFFRYLLREQLLLQWPMHTAAIDAWLGTLAPAVLSTSDNDKRTIGVMNRFVDEFTFKLGWFRTPLSEPHLRVANWNLNNNVVSGGANRNAYTNPEEQMARVLGVPYDRVDAEQRHQQAKHVLDRMHLRLN